MSTTPKTILVADDESHILHVVSLKLRNAGYRVVTARGYHLEPHDTEQSGILRMLSKPFSPRHLLATVNEVLAQAA